MLSTSTSRQKVWGFTLPTNPGCLLRLNLSYSNDNVLTILGLPRNGDTLDTKFGKSSANAKRSTIRARWKKAKGYWPEELVGLGERKPTTAAELWYPDVNGNIISGKTFATRLNNFFISVTSDLQPLDTSKLLAFLPSLEQPPPISTTVVR